MKRGIPTAGAPLESPRGRKRQLTAWTLRRLLTRNVEKSSANEITAIPLVLDMPSDWIIKDFARGAAEEFCKSSWYEERLARSRARVARLNAENTLIRNNIIGFPVNPVPAKCIVQAQKYCQTTISFGRLQNIKEPRLGRPYPPRENKPLNWDSMSKTQRRNWRHNRKDKKIETKAPTVEIIEGNQQEWGRQRRSAPSDRLLKNANLPLRNNNNGDPWVFPGIKVYILRDGDNHRKKGLVTSVTRDGVISVKLSNSTNKVVQDLVECDLQTVVPTAGERVICVRGKHRKQTFVVLKTDWDCEEVCVEADGQEVYLKFEDVASAEWNLLQQYQQYSSDCAIPLQPPLSPHTLSSTLPEDNGLVTPLDSRAGDSLVHVEAHSDNWWGRGSYRPCVVKVNTIVAGEINFSLLLDPALPNDAETVLREDLARVALMMPSRALEAIANSCHIFANLDNGQRGACTHWAMKEFEEVEDCRPRQFSIEIHRWSDHFDLLLSREGTFLHELSHIYNATLGHDHPPIVEMHKLGCESKKYEEVDLIDGSKKRAYGIQNHLEFFASLAVPFFGGINDYYPFTRSDLKAYDPESFSALKRIWAEMGDAIDAISGIQTEFLNHNHLTKPLSKRRPRARREPDIEEGHRFGCRDCAVKAGIDRGPRNLMGAQSTSIIPKQSEALTASTETPPLDIRDTLSQLAFPTTYFQTNPTLLASWTAREVQAVATTAVETSQVEQGLLRDSTESPPAATGEPLSPAATGATTGAAIGLLQDSPGSTAGAYEQSATTTAAATNNPPATAADRSTISLGPDDQETEEPLETTSGPAAATAAVVATTGTAGTAMSTAAIVGAPVAVGSEAVPTAKPVYPGDFSLLSRQQRKNWLHKQKQKRK